MGKRRIVDMDGLCFDAEITDLGTDGCLLYIRLWTLAEDWGGIDLDPKNILLQMGGLRDSYDSPKIAEIIDKLVKLNKVIVYQHKRRRYGWIKNLPKHQELRFPSPPKLPLPYWVVWHPKIDSKSPSQHYEYISTDISNDTTTDTSIDTSPEQSVDCATVNEEKRSRREINTNTSFLEANKPSTSAGVNGKHLNNSEKDLLHQLGGGSLMKPLKGDRRGMELTDRQEKNIKQDLERIRLENEKRGIKPQ